MGYDDHSKDFMDVSGSLLKCWYMILMDIGLPLYNGYHWCQEFIGFPKFQLCFFPHGIQAWMCHGHQYEWRRLCRKPLIKCAHLPSQGLLRAPQLAQIKNLLGTGGHPQSQIHGLGVYEGRSSS